MAFHHAKWPARHFARLRMMTLRLGLMCLIAAGAAAFAFFYTTSLTRWFNVRASDFIAWRGTLVLQYKFANDATGNAVPLLSSTISFMLIWQWCGVLAVALAAAGLLWLSSGDRWGPPAAMPPAPATAAPKGTMGAAAKKAARRFGRLLRCEVAPRGLWRNLLGPSGLSVLELLLVLLWFGLHAMWMYEMTMTALDKRRMAQPTMGLLAPSNATQPAVKPLPRAVQESVAKYTGWVGRLDLLLLFFPLARCNFLHWLLDSDFPTLIKYHRWMGHGTLLVHSIHGIMYMWIWSRDGILVDKMNWGMAGGGNRLAGVVSMIGGWLLWVTCIPVIRRRLFNLFYSCHLLGALTFLLFGAMHHKSVGPWIMPGLFLYLLDVVLRTIQQNFNSTTVSAVADTASSAPPAASISADGGMLTLSLTCDQALTWVGSDTVFLNVPAISWWQWHPFSLASSAAPGADGEKRMVLHIKQYSRWTQRLISRLATDATPLQLYVSGPYLGADRKWMTNFDRHVFVVGGIGMTPALGMLQELIARRRAAAAAAGDDAEAGGGAPKSPSSPSGRASLIWISRSMDEFRALPCEVLQEASRGNDPWLDLRLFLTGAPEPAHGEATKGAASSMGPSGNLLSVSIRCDTVTKASPSVAAAVATVTRPRTRPLAHPYMLSPLLWMVAVVLCFGGGFAGLICAQAYDAHKSRTVIVRDDFSFVGMLQLTGLVFGAVVPPTLLMLAAHIHRMGSLRRSARVTPATTTAWGTKRWGHGLNLAAAAELGAFVTRGRPDTTALLHRLAASGSISKSCLLDPDVDIVDLRVAVYAAGSAPLVGTVLDACAALNGVWGRRGRAYLDAKAITQEL